MTCPACTLAAERVSHEFRANCPGCCARAAGRSPQFHEAGTRRWTDFRRWLYG